MKTIKTIKAKLHPADRMEAVVTLTQEEVAALSRLHFYLFTHADTINVGDRIGLNRNIFPILTDILNRATKSERPDQLVVGRSI